jgi:hypothetical protein
MSDAVHGIGAFDAFIEAVLTAVRGRLNAPAVSLEH